MLDSKATSFPTQDDEAEAEAVTEVVCSDRATRSFISFGDQCAASQGVLGPCGKYNSTAPSSWAGLQMTALSVSPSYGQHITQGLVQSESPGGSMSKRRGDERQKELRVCDHPRQAVKDGVAQCESDVTALGVSELRFHSFCSIY